jgi:flagellar basal-body rod protein FlgG
MIRGYYTAASGIVTQEKKLNTYANNIANVSTAGYKKDNLVEGTFGEHMAVRMNAYQNRATVDIGRGVYMQTVVDEYTDHIQGAFTETGRPMDFAIQGDGFFVVADEEGNEYLTRDGQFSLDDEGYLVLPGYGRVQGDAGDIEIGTSEFQVDRNGVVSTFDEDGESTEIDRLSIALVDDYDAMQKAANGMFVSDDYGLMGEEGNIGTAVFQGRVEASNVGMVEEMSRMLSTQRSLQSCSQIVKMYDELSDQMNTRISRIQ